MTEHTVKPERYPATHPSSNAASGSTVRGGPADAVRARRRQTGPEVWRPRATVPRSAGPRPAAPVERDQPLVSVVMPCLNERDSVGRCVRAARAGLAAAGVPGEVVVADNGSTDGSRRVAAQAGAWVVREPRRGYGNAYLAGFAAARGHYLVMGDSDCSYDFGELPRLLDPLRGGRADYVLGSRFAGDIRPGAMPWTHRRIGNPVLTRMLNRLFGLRTTDAHSGMRAFTRAAYERMAPRQGGMELASELVVAAAASGLRVREVPITYHPRTGTSKLHSLRDAARHVRFMLGYAARLRAGKPPACTPGNGVDPRP